MIGIALIQGHIYPDWEARYNHPNSEDRAKAVSADAFECDSIFSYVYIFSELKIICKSIYKHPQTYLRPARYSPLPGRSGSWSDGRIQVRRDFLMADQSLVRSSRFVVVRAFSSFSSKASPRSTPSSCIRFLARRPMFRLSR